MPADSIPAASGGAGSWERRARLHGTARWIGIALFCVGAVVLVMNIGAVATGRAPGARILLSIFGLGMSLGAFGANNDTTIHALARLQAEGAVPAAFTAEWKRERSLRSARIPGTHASPRMAFALPVVAAMVVGWGLVRGLSAWGIL